jgi:hypothetical protein
MDKKTHYEQVPLDVMKKLIAAGSKPAKSASGGKQPKKVKGA